MTKHLEDYKESIKGQDQKLSELIEKQQELLKKNQETLDRIINSSPDHLKKYETSKAS